MNEVDKVYRSIFSQTLIRQKFKMFVTLVLVYTYIRNFGNCV